MDVILATSRGKAPLESLIRENLNCPDQLYVEARPGAQMGILEDRARELLRTMDCDATQEHHVYIMAGLCDMTTRIKDHYFDPRGRRSIYEEWIFPESPAQAVPRLAATIDSIITIIKSQNARPCIMTIAPMSLVSWNNIRLNQHKTTHLIHHNQYSDMQHHLNQTTLQINKYIIQRNKENNMITPKIATYIIQNPGKGKPHRFHYSRLQDGVHPKECVVQKWADHISSTINTNRANHS